MNRKNIFIGGMLILGSLTTGAQTIKVSGTEASANGEMQIVITADASISNYIATGFFVELPEGFSVAGVEGVKGDAVQSNHLVRVGQTGSSKFRVAVYSLTNSAFGVQGGAPTLCTLKLKAPNKNGNFTGRLTGVEFSTASHTLAKENGLQFNISLKSSVGDADGNGVVDASDVKIVVDYIMGKNPANFVFANANMNGDNVVDAADLVLLISMPKSK